MLVGEITLLAGRCSVSAGGANKALCMADAAGANELDMRALQQLLCHRHGVGDDGNVGQVCTPAQLAGEGVYRGACVEENGIAGLDELHGAASELHFFRTKEPFAHRVRERDVGAFNTSGAAPHPAEFAEAL